MEESGITAQFTETWQQQVLHCVFAQHGDNFTHDLYREEQEQSLVPSQAQQWFILLTLNHEINRKPQRNKMSTEVEKEQK